MRDDTTRAFFGRRVGQRLRPGQERLVNEVLPTLRLPESGPVELTSLFPASLFPPSLFPAGVSDGSLREIRLEIGFGGAEHLLAAALAEPDVGFIGVEPFVNGLAKALAVIEARDIRNIRLWDDDAARLLKRIPDAALARVDLFYPDPWPKRRQRKRRFVSDETLRDITRVLRPDGAFRFATDIDDYAGWTLVRLARSQEVEGGRLSWTGNRPADWQMPPQGWVRTRYEAKAILAGRKPTYVTAIKTLA